jgi:hypothetical protein
MMISDTGMRRLRLLWRRRLIVWSVAAVISCIAIWFMTSMQPASLTDGLIGSVEFDDRVKARFPTGSLERDVMTELRREGFSTEEGRAVREEQRPPCKKIAVVQWQVDAAGRLTAISGAYITSCPSAQ